MSEKLRIYHLLADNPSWLQIIKEAFEAEEKYYQRYPKEKYPDMEWLGFEWHQVHGRPATLNKMVANRILDVSYSSHSATNYMITEPELVKEVIAMLEEQNGEMAEDKLTVDIFNPIINYEEDKKQFIRAVNRVLSGGKPTHFLLEGVPASGKSLFIDCIADALGGRMYIATGANTTEAGLSEMLMREYTVVAVDEIDFLEAKAMSVLLRFMETGDIVQTKHARIKEGIRTNTMVVGACNSSRRIPPALISRFYPYHLYFPPYTKEQFIEICENWLPAKEGIASNEIARYIAERLYNKLGHNTDPRTARGLARQLEEGTKEEVDEQINFLKKRGKLNLG